MGFWKAINVKTEIYLQIKPFYFLQNRFIMSRPAILSEITLKRANNAPFWKSTIMDFRKCYFSYSNVFLITKESHCFLQNRFFMSRSWVMSEITLKRANNAPFWKSTIMDFRKCYFFYAKVFLIKKESYCFLQNRFFMSSSWVIRPDNISIEAKIWKNAPFWKSAIMRVPHTFRRDILA